ncbi:signal peptidase I [Flavobacterium sp.]|uniref:signal peptidase I n=1 Tax=Flavobacterium sp. TaxID=239 RepID=UPI002B4B206D|nr:signal peptidase I [Flavobacterium sp.]HLF51737.1 signal peptidase I [Flavobacterium sp.]
MTVYQWFVFFLLIQIVHFLGTWKLYEAAGRKRWEAAIPVYNAIVLMKITNRPTWWTILLFVPVVNLIMFPVVWVETLRSFGKNSTFDTVLGIATLGFYIYYINYTQPLNYISDRSLIPQNKTADTISSILFAIVVATIVHGYVIQPYNIPTSSLEKSLLVGDFLFVSKFHYGARTPMTPIAAPMVHDTIPFINKKSYLSWPQLPYFRFFAMQEVNRTDIVVFNWPADTLYNMYKVADKRYDKPIDKKTNYVKRCVGIPGDSLSIKDGIVYINGKVMPMPERAKPQYSYSVTTDGSGFDPTYILKELNITDPVYIDERTPNTFYFRALTEESANRLKQNPIVKSVVRNISHEVEPTIFPQTKNWNVDNLGPIYIPQKGKTVALTAESLPFYKTIISEYEKNDLKVNGTEIRINGQIATNYTFKQDYYWMMGDNRHNSLDSRYWGYVPENHIVGKPVFIWMSLDPNGKGFGKIRWDRVFTTVSGDGQPQSYFKYFLIALALYFGISFFINKRKEKNS